MARLSKAIVLRHAAFREQTFQAVIPAGGKIQMLGVNAQRWAVVVMLQTAATFSVLWGGPDRQVNGISVVNAAFIRLDAVDFPSIVAQEIWVKAAAGTTVEACEIVAVD